jgi:ABC-type dipeptide transport system, periplasmic component
MKKCFVSFLLLLMLLVSCGRQPAEIVLDVAVSQEPPTLDVNKNSSVSSRLILVGNVFEKMLTLNGKGEAVPELAESYTVSEDARHFVFKLRENVLFHDGTPLTAKEAAASLNRWVDSYSAAAYSLGESRFVAKDDFTVMIDTEVPVLQLPLMLASSPQSAVIMSAASLDSLDANGFLTSFCGTGPYRFEEWKRGDSVVLTKNSGYSPYGGVMDGLAGKKETNFDKIVYHFVPDAVTRTLGLESGQFDFINDVMNDDIPRLEKKKDLEIYRGNEAGSFTLVYNKKSGPASDEYFRKAVAYGIDFEEILKACYGAGGYTLRGEYMDDDAPFWQTGKAEEFYNIKDKALALKYLEESSYSGESVKILASNLSNMEKSAVALKSELEKLGIKSEITITDWATFMSLRKDLEAFDILITAFSSVPVPSLKLYLSPSYPGWSEDEALMNLMADFNSATDNRTALEIWSETQEFCYDYLPVSVLGHYLSGYGGRKKLKGVNTAMGFWFWNADFQ